MIIISKEKTISPATTNRKLLEIKTRLYNLLKSYINCGTIIVLEIDGDYEAHMINDENSLDVVMNKFSSALCNGYDVHYQYEVINSIEPYYKSVLGL